MTNTMNIIPDIQSLLDAYAQRRDQRERRLQQFWKSTGGDFLVIQHPYKNTFGSCNSVQQVVDNNLEYTWAQLALDWTDDLPYLEPWVGTGVYANAFGCEYIFREFEAPAVHYRYHSANELRGLEYPDYRQSPIMRMVLDCIDALKESTRGCMPIALTDTQSPLDTATLILDACECFRACYMEEELIRHFLELIRDLTIEFSRVQMARIGTQLLIQPGHSMPGFVGGRGISVSDDNLAVASPWINQNLAIPIDLQLADALGGVAIHSCGTWTHAMAELGKYQGVIGIECAAGPGHHDPQPNKGSEVRKALAGTRVVAKVRVGEEINAALDTADELADPNLKLILEIPYDEANAQRNYQLVRDRLERIYCA